MKLFSQESGKKVVPRAGTVIICGHQHLDNTGHWSRDNIWCQQQHCFTRSRYSTLDSAEKPRFIILETST